ncbi:MAG: hypothetical protein ABI947_03490 [Chloroflexota bacterium]
MVDPTQASNESKTELPSSLWTAAWWKSTGMVAIGIALGLVLLLLIMLFARDDPAQSGCSGID